ncbi:MAG: AAA family ATPase, partial [Bacteroidota bacterium]
DIKPDNILIHPETKAIFLSDFGIATRLSGSKEPVLNPRRLEGTLTYISPEQTGRINRTMDFRSDFYSLGVTLYEIVAGDPPFLSRDPMEMIHAHIARTPVPLNRQTTGVPIMVSDIVGKLIAKAPEDRYQSMAGLIADLEYCNDSLQKTGAINRVETGREDYSSRFLVPERLFGREAEVALLQRAFAMAATGTTELCMVKGPSGMGKSMVVREAFKQYAAGEAYFSGGKFDRLNRKIPYSALMQALSGVIEQILMENEAEIARWKTRILDALGPNGQLLIDEIPQLELLIGAQPPVKELPADETRARFQSALLSFIGSIAHAEQPVALFLDDMQWADSATFEILENVIQSPDIRHVLLLGSYRSEEVDESHPVSVIIEKLEKITEIHEVSLFPLRKIHVAEILAETLKTSSSEVDGLAQLVLEKTSGTPFFLFQFIRSLYEENFVRFSIEERAWEWDLSEIRAADITDNVVELLISKLKKLPESTLNLLKTASCMGKSVNLRELSEFTGQSEAAIATAFTAAVQQQFLLPENDGFGLLIAQRGLDEQSETTIEGTPPAVLRFVHDRIQHAVYSLLPELERKQTHLVLGRILIRKAGQSMGREELFRVVMQLDHAVDLIMEQEERIQLAELNLVAAIRAKESNAFGTAMEFLELGIELLPNDAWESNYETMAGLQALKAECLYLTMQTEESVAAFDEAIRRATTRIAKIRLYKKKLVLLSARLRVDEA